MGRGAFFAAQGNLSGSCGQLEVPEARPHGARGEGVPRRSPLVPILNSGPCQKTLWEHHPALLRCLRGHGNRPAPGPAC